MIIFDSNVWIAFLHKADTNHTRAEDIFQRQGRPIGIPEYVIIEVASVLSKKAGKELADKFLDMVLNSKDVEVLFSEDQFFLQVAEFFKKRKEKHLSFVDFSLLYLVLETSYLVITFDKQLLKAIGSKK